MNKEIKLLIEMCKSTKKEFTNEELATLMKLKFVEGVYPYIKRLENEGFLYKKNRGIYSLNESSPKVETIFFMIKLFGNDIDLLFTIHTKRILERFSIKPILIATELPYQNLRWVKNIATKTKILYSVNEKNSQVYFIRTWEEPTHRLLDFFDIKLQFDPEEHRLKVMKHFSGSTVKQAHLKNEKDIQLAQVNMQNYLEGKDLILNKLKIPEISELSIIKILTENKTKRMTNPFEITSRINDWKIKYIYNTDKIEGNILTMEEVRTILTVGMESVKKDKKNVLETQNSKTALDNIFDTHNELTIEFIKKLHLATQQGIDEDAGQYKTEENCVVDDSGTLIDTTTPARFVEERMFSLVRWYTENKSQLHPLIVASIFHNQFVYIHPFSDGNGRVSRLLLNFILIKSSCFPIIIYNDQKHRYYSALRQSKSGDIMPFVIYISDLYREQLESF